MKTYRVVESFLTVQGEGRYAGSAAVFVRFAGCNLWTGHDEHRERDAFRHDARCPLWCDTDFRVGVSMTAAQIGERVRDLAGRAAHVVLTGGEPLLHVDAELVRAIRAAHPIARIAVETNGTTRPRDGVVLSCESWVPQANEVIDWVCCSPKMHAESLVLSRVDELKVVVPDYDPHSFAAIGARYRFVQPRASTSTVGRSVVDADAMRAAAAFVMANPEWRLSLQTHKIAGVP